MSFLLRYISETVEKIASSVPLLISVGIVQFGFFFLLNNATEKLEAEFGAKSPDTRFGYNEQEYYQVLDTWGIAGCTAYLDAAVFRFFFIPAYVTLLSAVLWRSYVKVNWDTGIVPQLAAAMLLSDYSETCVLFIACMQYPERLPPSLLGFGDLSNKVKFVSVSIVALLIFIGAIIKAYIWPLLMLSPKQQARAMAPANAAKKKSDAASAKKKSDAAAVLNKNNNNNKKTQGAKKE